MKGPVRIEHDLLGDRAVPADAYYGIHTLRALENFPITGTPISIYPDLVAALACVKQAAAIANNELGLLDEQRARGDPPAPARRSAKGKLHEAVRGRRDPGRRRHLDQHERQRGDRATARSSCWATLRGEYQHLHPLDHVNLSQSTNDVYPTAVKLALHFGIRRLLRRDGRAAGSLRGQGARVRRRAEGGAHAAAGRGADDARPGVLDLRGDARRGRAAPGRGGKR